MLCSEVFLPVVFCFVGFPSLFFLCYFVLPGLMFRHVLFGVRLSSGARQRPGFGMQNVHNAFYRVFACFAMLHNVLFLVVVFMIYYVLLFGVNDVIASS